MVVGGPQQDLDDDQRAVFYALAPGAVIWKGRTAPDPMPDISERLMCLNASAPADATEGEPIVETTSSEVTCRGTTHCPPYNYCGKQARKRRLEVARVVLTAHDTLSVRPAMSAARSVCWCWMRGSGALRGKDGKALLTLDGLRPHPGPVQCWISRSQEEWEATANLGAQRGRLWKVLRSRAWRGCKRGASRWRLWLHGVGKEKLFAIDLIARDGRLARLG